MPGTISQNSIEQVRQASDIVDVIGQYLRLKKRGRNFTALCPFHVEKTPSFSVSQEKQIFHCFGCGKGGNVFTFLMEHEKLSFLDAVRLLARRAGIRLEEKRESGIAREEIEKLYYAHQVAVDYYRGQLRSSKYRDIIQDYLKRKRRLSDDSIERFQLGIAGEEWDGFLNYAIRKDLFPTDLEKAGLIQKTESGERYRDRFRYRLMIPIFNLSDKVIAFGGRALKKGDSAKYINSPETPLYSKSNVLYGLNFSRQEIRDKNEVIIVEGYFDFISLYQAGIKNVVASSGTAFTSPQARLLARFADTAYLFFDSDSAGQAAALRSVDSLYDAGMEVMVMIPPPGKDPDLVAVDDGAAGIETLRQAGMPYLDFRVKDMPTGNLGIIAKEKLIKELADLAGKIGDMTRRSLFLEEASRKLGIAVENFQRLLPREKIEKTAPLIKPPRKILDIERELLALVISNPEHIDVVREKLIADDFQGEAQAKIFSLIMTIYKIHGTISQSILIDMVEDKELAAEISSMLSLEIPSGDIGTLIRDYIKKLLAFKRERLIDRLKGELKLAEEAGDNAAAKSIMKEIAALIQRRQD
ncbi:MAG: DNA primase [bacterium]|jgi:DNA primase